MSPLISPSCWNFHHLPRTNPHSFITCDNSRTGAVRKYWSPPCFHDNADILQNLSLTPSLKRIFFGLAIIIFTVYKSQQLQGWAAHCWNLLILGFVTVKSAAQSRSIWSRVSTERLRGKVARDRELRRFSNWFESLQTAINEVNSKLLQ